jgi:hypothetical protein
MFRHATDNGTILADKSLQIGIRTAYIADDDYLRIHAPEAMAMPPRDLARAIADRIGTAPCCICYAETGPGAGRNSSTV